MPIPSRSRAVKWRHANRCLEPQRVRDVSRECKSGSIQCTATILTALALVPVGAHVLELPNKIHLDQAQYVAVQQIYRGWALLGIVLIAALLADLLSAVLARSQRMPMLFAASAAVLLGVTLAVFFIWTFTVNQVTNNWTVAPDDWEALRATWEYSHATNAALTFLALCAAVASGSTRRGSRAQ